MKNEIKIFEQNNIRSVYDEENKRMYYLVCKNDKTKNLLNQGLVMLLKHGEYGLQSFQGKNMEKLCKKLEATIKEKLIKKTEEVAEEYKRTKTK